MDFLENLPKVSGHLHVHLRMRDFFLFPRAGKLRGVDCRDCCHSWNVTDLDIWT